MQNRCSDFSLKLGWPFWSGCWLWLEPSWSSNVIKMHHASSRSYHENSDCMFLKICLVQSFWFWNKIKVNNLTNCWCFRTKLILDLFHRTIHRRFRFQVHWQWIHTHTKKKKTVITGFYICSILVVIQAFHPLLRIV